MCTMCVRYIRVAFTQHNTQRGKTYSIDQEPRGVSLVGKVTNFYWYYDVWYGPQIEEQHVCRVPCGGCGNGGGAKTGTQIMA